MIPAWWQNTVINMTNLGGILGGKSILPPIFAASKFEADSLDLPGGFCAFVTTKSLHIRKPTKTPIATFLPHHMLHDRESGVGACCLSRQIYNLQQTCLVTVGNNDRSPETAADGVSAS